MSCIVVLGYPKASSVRIVITGALTAKAKVDLLADVKELAKTYGLKYKQITSSTSKRR